MNQSSSRSKWTNWRNWIPTPGNIVFALIVGLLFWQVAGAAPGAARTAAPTIASTAGIPYQGRLASAGGVPLTGTYTMVFRLYAASSGGSPLWEEQWTGPNGVKISDGLFNVMLGSLTPVPNNVVIDNSNLWLGITVNTDNEMSPRVQLGIGTTSIYALNVPDASITAAKLAPGAVPPGVPVGTVISWWRPNSSTPLPSGEWMIADGSVVTDSASLLYNQTLPNLTDKFVMGVSAANIGTTGGSNTLDLSHSHSIPSHTHNVNGTTGEVDGFWDGGYYTTAGDGKRFADRVYSSNSAAWYYRHNHRVDLTTSAWSGNTGSTTLTADNRPQYYGLIYLVRIK
jgi:hypothetical protein